MNEERIQFKIINNSNENDNIPKIISFPSDMLGLKFHGYDYDNHNTSYDMNNYAVGILDTNNNIVQLQSLHHIFTMNIMNNKDDNISESNLSLTSFDRKHNLTDVFGTKKKKRVMKQMESNIISSDNITGVDAISDAITVTVQSNKQTNNNNNDNNNDDDEDSNEDDNNNNNLKGSENAAEQALLLHREQMLPRFNQNGKTLNEVYAESDLMTPSVEKSIKEYLARVQRELNEINSQKLELNTLKEYLSEKGWNQICLDLVDMVYSASYNPLDTQNNKTFFKHLRMIYFLSCMMKFTVCLLSSNKRFISREELFDGLSKPPLPIIKYLTDSFALHKKIQETHTFQSTKTHADKLLMHLLIVCLHCMGGTISINPLSEYLKISTSRLVILSREIGCNVLNKKTTATNEGANDSSSTTTSLTAQITFPFKFPDRRKVKASRR